MFIPKWLEKAVVRWIRIDRYLPLQIDITNACNLSCDHCYHSHHKNDGALTLTQWANIIRQYFTLLEKTGYDPYIIICGGEPLLSPKLSPLLGELGGYFERYKDRRLAILTNGVLAKRIDLSTLSRFPMVEFQISIDGPDARRHDEIRGRGNFEKSLAGARFLLENGFQVDFLAVLSGRSAMWIKDFFSMAKEVRVRNMGFTRLIVQGQALNLAKSGSDRPLGPLELRMAYLTIIDEVMRTGVRSNLHHELSCLIHPSFGRSGRFGEGIVVDYQGKIIASSRSRLELGDALKDGLEQIFFHHPILKKLRAGQIEVCGDCEYLRICGGNRNAAFAETGNYLGPDPGCWKKVVS